MAKWGLEFMQEMVQLAAQKEKEGVSDIRSDRYVQILSPPYFSTPIIIGAPAQYGVDLYDSPVEAGVAIAHPIRACTRLTNEKDIRGKVAIVERSDCMFQEKTRYAQQAGAVGVIVVDHVWGTSVHGQPSFAMASDRESPDDIVIPSVFVYHKEGHLIMDAVRVDRKLVVRISAEPLEQVDLIRDFFATGKPRKLPLEMMCPISAGNFIELNSLIPSVLFNFRFEGVEQDSEPVVCQEIVERHVSQLQDTIDFELLGHRAAFFNLMRTAAYGALGLNVEDEDLKVVDSLRSARLLSLAPVIHKVLKGQITQVRCMPKEDKMQCVRIAD